jgi:hypothetical protein
MFKVDKKDFSPEPKADNRVLKGKKTIFLSTNGMCLSIFLFLSELGPLYTSDQGPGQIILLVTALGQEP